MKVKELIALLQKENPEDEIFVENHSDFDGNGLVGYEPIGVEAHIPFAMKKDGIIINTQWRD
jgi:hypothetical protein